jgi:hypothetical protein
VNQTKQSNDITTLQATLWSYHDVATNKLSFFRYLAIVCLTGKKYLKEHKGMLFHKL